MMSNSKNIKKGVSILLLISMSFANACKTSTSVPPETNENKTTASVPTEQTTGNKPVQAVSASGILQEQGVTTYQYGTHVLVDVNGKTLYALKSTTIKLNNYLGKKVQLQGVPVEDYPLEGGPDYLEVLTINE
jgi:hypothetical protein